MGTDEENVVVVSFLGLGNDATAHAGITKSEKHSLPVKDGRMTKHPKLDVAHVSKIDYSRD